MYSPNTSSGSPSDGRRHPDDVALTRRAAAGGSRGLPPSCAHVVAARRSRGAIRSRASAASVATQQPVSARYGTASAVASATAPPAAAPTAAPGAQARLTSANAYAWSSPSSSAVSARSESAGDQNAPNAIPAATTTAASAQRLPIQGSVAV